MRWPSLEDELLAMVDDTLSAYRADAGRVYLTGLSYGGYGTWFLGTRHPHRWAAMAPICGGGDPKAVDRLAAHQLPLWIFHGGRDTVVPPSRSVEMAVAIEAAGHRTSGSRSTKIEDTTSGLVSTKARISIPGS